MKILNAIIVVAVLVSNSAQAITSLRNLTCIEQQVAAKLATYGLPKLEKLDRNYLVQQFFNAGVELSQDEILSLTEWDDAFIDKITGSSKEDASHLLKLSLEYLYNGMVAGETGIAETMIDKGVDLDKVDLQALLYDALKQLNLESPHSSTEWLDWLLAHGADINEPMFNLEIAAWFLKAGDGDSLDWLLGNSEVTVEQLDKLLPLSLWLGSYKTFLSLMRSRYGVSEDLLNSDLRDITSQLLSDDENPVRLPALHYIPDTKKQALLQFIMLNSLWKKHVSLETSQEITSEKTLADIFAHHIANTNISQDTLNKVLEATAEIATESSRDYTVYITAMDKLLELGASIDTLDLQQLLYDTLEKETPAEELAKWTIKHGANINELDLNRLVEKAINNRSYVNRRIGTNKEAIDARSFFALLHKLGMDTEQLNLPQLLEEAEEKDRRIKRSGGEDAPTTGYVEQLRLLQQK